jgi:hypothetical protein
VFGLGLLLARCTRRRGFWGRLLDGVMEVSHHTSDIGRVHYTRDTDYYLRSLSCFGLWSRKLYTLAIAHCSLLSFILIGALTNFLNVPFIRTDIGWVLYAPMPLL